MSKVATDLRTGMELEVERIKPFGTNILIHILERDREQGGLILEHRKDNWEGTNQGIRAKVLSIGPNVSPDLDVNVGDIIFIVAHAGKWVGDSDDINTPYRMIEEDEVLAVEHP